MCQYQLRPLPHPDRAPADPTLVPFIADKADPDWPAIGSTRDLKKLGDWIKQESFVKSVNVSLRADGRVEVSMVFTLFVFWHMHDPLASGWFVNHVHLMDDHLRDFGWNVLYTTSASRWIDCDFSLGYERDKNDLGANRRFWVGETGVRLRANIRHSPLSFLSKLTDFWSVRVGL